jgi:LytR cell envelope-related transcriptional attenuator
VDGRHEPPSRSSFWISLATAALRAALVAAAVILGVFVLSRAFPTTSEAPSSITESPSPAVEETQSPAAPTEESPEAAEPRNPSRVTLQVLNGTDTTGLAAETAELLEQEGYNIITITDADRPYETTTLFYHPDAEVDAQFLQQNFFPEAVLERSAPDAEVDVTVILGDDYAAAQEGEETTESPSPTPTEEAT